MSQMDDLKEEGGLEGGGGEALVGVLFSQQRS